MVRARAWRGGSSRAGVGLTSRRDSSGFAVSAAACPWCLFWLSRTLVPQQKQVFPICAFA